MARTTCGRRTSRPSRATSGAAHRANDEYAQAIVLCREAHALAAGEREREPALFALTSFALGYYLLEGEGFHDDRESPTEHIEPAVRILDAAPEADPVLRRVVSLTLRRAPSP